MISHNDITLLIDEFKNSQKILIAIGDQVRQHIIIQMLACNQNDSTHCNGMRVGEIAALTNLSRPAISHHLQILKEAGILNMRREGTKNYYYFDTDTMALQNLICLLEHTKQIMAQLPDRSGEND